MAKQHAVDMSAFQNCMQDPQALLSKALKERNVHDFKIALEMEADPTRIDEETHISIFEKALQTYGCHDFVEECLKRGCKCDYVNRRLNKMPINFATDSRDPRILLTILKYSKNHNQNVSINHKYSNLTPLNSLSKSITNDNYHDIFECIKLLLNYGGNPNLPDQKEYTPILYILNNRKLNDNHKYELIKYLLENHDIDLDTYRDGECRKILTEKYPNIQLPLINYSIDEFNINNCNYDILLSYLRNYNEEKFIKIFNLYETYLTKDIDDNTTTTPTKNDNISTSSNNNGVQKTEKNFIIENNMKLLFESIKLGLNNCCKEILKSNLININFVINGNTAIEIACVYGNYEILQILLDSNELKLRKYENLLIKIIKKLDNQKFNNEQQNSNNLNNDFDQNLSNYLNCFYTLLKSLKINVNEYDESGTTALHYAIKYKNDLAVLELLKYGAYIGQKSQFNDIAIANINSDLLENYFDSCIMTNRLKPGDDNFEILINYKNLIPPSSLSTSTTTAIATTTTQSNSNLINSEMLPIEYISNTKELKYLLKHPLITSFLYLKWHQLSILFYINFLLYTLFSISIITYIILNFNSTITTDYDKGVLILFKLLTFCSLIYLIVRELLQFFISPKLYVKSVINYIELILIVLISIHLFSNLNSNNDLNENKNGLKFLSVFIILLITIELCLLIGSLPISSISTHMLMLREVTKTFIKSFALYSIFIITFSLCFYILFGKIENGNNGNLNGGSGVNSGDTNNDDDDGEFNKFVNPFTAIIKTIVMLTGEFDAGDLQFNSFTNYLVFLLFVFFMSIVLFNLLNGLAVNDTTAIKSQAELNGCICRTHLLASYEKALLGYNNCKTSYLFNYQPFRFILKRLINLFPNYINGNYIIILPNDCNKILIPSSSSSSPAAATDIPALNANTNNVKISGSNDDIALLMKNHQNNLSNDRNLNLFDDLDDNEKRTLNTQIKLLPCCCSFMIDQCSRMDIKIVKNALIIIEKNHMRSKEKNKIQENEIRLKKIEDKINKIFEMLQDNYLK